MFLQHSLLCLLTVICIVQATPTRTLSGSGPSVTGGDSSPDEDTCTDYKTCSSKGLGYWEQLQQKLSQATPVDRTDGNSIFATDYGCEFITIDEDSTPGLRNIRGDVENHGYEWNWVEGFGVFSKDPATGKENPETAYSNMLYTAKGLIVAVENYREADDRKTLPWSEIIYQAWQVAKEYDDDSKEANAPPGHPGGGDISTLQAIVRVNIENEETQAVLQTIWRGEGLEWNTLDQTWYRFTESDPATKNWFYALLGTVNVKGAVFLLSDHAAEIGKKTVTDIWVRWEGPNPDIWINIGPPS